MQDPHAPSPEFTSFLEWQTRTELRRRERFTLPHARQPRLMRLARVAALVLVSVFAGAGVVVAVERIQVSRALDVLLQRNQLLVELAVRRADAAREVAETARMRYEQGVAGQSSVAEAERRVAELERGRDHRRLDREELLAARRDIDPLLSAPLVGGRDFVSEHLRIDRACGERIVELREAEERTARLRFESGIVPQTELDRARRAAGRARAELARLDERLELRSDFLLERIDAATCENLDLVGDAEHRRRALLADAEHVRRELRHAEQLEALGAGAGLVGPLRAELDGIEVEVRSIGLELELLR